MRVLDQHIYVRQGLQKINSNAFRNVKDEEVDLALCRGQDVFIEEHYLGMGRGSKSLGYEQSQKRREDLSNLMIPHYVVTPFIAMNNVGVAERVLDSDTSIPIKYRVELADDHLILTGQRAKIFFNDCGTIEYVSTSTSATICAIPVDTSDENIGSSTVTNITYSFGNGTYTGSVVEGVGYLAWSDYTFPQDGDYFIEHFVRRLNDTISSAHGMNAYWEVYKDIFRPNSIIIVDSNGVHGYGKIYFDAFEMKNYTDTSAYIYYTNTVTESSGSYKVRGLKMRRYNNIDTLLVNSHHKPNSNNILATEERSHLDIYTDGTFIPTEVTLNYIRKPNNISLALNKSCELRTHTHESICDYAISYLDDLMNKKIHSQRLIEELKID